MEKGLVPIPKVILPIGKKVDSINFYTDSLKAINEDIANSIDRLQEIASQQPGDLEFDSDDGDESTSTGNGSLENHSTHGVLLNMFRANTEGVVKRAVKEQVRMTGKATGLVTKAATGAVKRVLPGEKDGHVSSAGFVVFGSLSTTHAARQMLHHGV